MKISKEFKSGYYFCFRLSIAFWGIGLAAGRYPGYTQTYITMILGPFSLEAGKKENE